MATEPAGTGSKAPATLPGMVQVRSVEATVSVDGELSAALLAEVAGGHYGRGRVTVTTGG